MNNKSIIPASDEVWNVIKETNKQIRANSTEMKRQWAETDKRWAETDKRWAETNKQISTYIKETQRGLREAKDLFTSQWGRLIESLVEGDLIKLLTEKKIDVDSTLTNMKGEYKGDHWEIDIVAINGKEVVLVEVKTTLKVKDIEYFTKKLKIFTTWRPEYKGKKVYGAVAYLKADENSTKYAEKKGLFVIRATGSSASIINKKAFKPKAFD